MRRAADQGKVGDKFHCAFPKLQSGTSPPIRRHALAAIKAAILPGRPSFLITPRLKIGFSPLR